MYEQRIKTVRRNLANRGLEQMLVCDPRSIHYLTGAFIEPGERVRVDTRTGEYLERAKG